MDHNLEPKKPFPKLPLASKWLKMAPNGGPLILAEPFFSDFGTGNGPQGGGDLPGLTEGSRWTSRGSKVSKMTIFGYLKGLKTKENITKNNQKYNIFT